MQPVSSIKKHFPHTFLVGVTGHTDMLGEEKLEKQVHKILAVLKTKHKKNLALLCPGATGADQLVAAVAASLNIPVIGIYVADYNCHPTTQKEFGSNLKWLHNQQNTPGFRELYLGDCSFESKLASTATIGNTENRTAAIEAIILHMHAATAAVIAGGSDYIIALWDGVDNGKTGGTSEAVHMALHKKDFNGLPIAFTKPKKGIFTKNERSAWKTTWREPKGRLYHIVTPRTKNPFTVGRFPAAPGQPFPHVGAYETAATPFPILPFKGNQRQRWWMKFKVNFIYNGIFLSFILPAIFAALTVGFGSFGFKDLRHLEEWKIDSTSANGYGMALERLRTSSPSKTELQLHNLAINNYNWTYRLEEPYPQANDVFNAVNLLTFNSSADISPEKVPRKLNFARWAGLGFVLNAFLIALLFAIGKNNKTRFKAWWWVLLRKRFYLISGLNDKSFGLAKDLKRQGKSVIIIDGKPDSNKAAEAEKKGVALYEANSYSSAALLRIKAASAAKVFLLDNDDVVNIRTLQELAQLKPSGAVRHVPKTKHGKFGLKPRKSRKQNRYIHLKEGYYKDFVCSTHPDTHKTATHVFNIYENTARRLLLHYPIHRFNADPTPETAEIFVFGFGEMAEQLILSCLRSGFYSTGKELKITVFATDVQDKAQEFYRRYPALWHAPEQNAVYEKAFAKKIRNEIFPPYILVFKELPLSDAAYFSDASIQEAIMRKHIVSLYFCLPQYMQSAAYLYAILPKIQHLQASNSLKTPVCDVQCYCHYNLYDKDEVAYVEHMVNAKIPFSPVIFFGSFADECAEAAITGRSDDLLPKLIHVWYTHDNIANKDGTRKDKQALFQEREEFWLQRRKENRYIKRSIKKEADSRWGKLSITHKESNRYAADHLWVKLHLMGFTYQSILNDVAELADFTQISGSRFSGKIEDIAVVEHRRWSAEKLLEGFLPAQDYDTSLAVKHAQAVREWNSQDRAFKNYYQEQKLHIDLLPFNELLDGDLDEKIKDISLIEAIPWFIHVLNEQ